MIGTVISHYKILEKLGEGGMGVVYKAHDTTLDRNVALKFLPHYLSSDETEKERFYHEARAAAALSHPNIAVIHEIGEHTGPQGEKQLFLVMEFVEGTTLKKLVGEEREPLSVKRVLDISIQVCEGLAAAHEKGIVHRDIKSDNIMLTSKGQAKIMDFGLAKVKGSTKLTKAGSTLGTAASMSPEQAQGDEVDQRSDIFSFGVVLYELLTGKLPFRGEHHSALLYSLINEDPAPIGRFNEKVSPELERCVMKALAKDREERYQHVDDLLADLRRERKNMEYARTGYIRTSSAVPEPSAVTTSKQKLVRYAIPAVLVVGLVIAALVFNPFSLQVTTQKTVASEQNSLAVMYFQNIPDPEDKEHTGDMLADLLITSLSQTKGLEVISRERLFDIQKELKADAKSITPDMASEIAKRAGVTTMLLGSILQTEPQLAVTTRLIDVRSGRIINSQRVTGFSVKQMFPLVDTLAGLVRNDLSVLTAASEPLKSVSELTASSPEAFRSYTEGVELNKKFFSTEAKAAFKRAIELDSNFVMAYYGLATLNGSTTAMEQRAAIEKAWKLRDKVTERERLTIEAAYAFGVGNDPAKAAQINETIVSKYPHEQSTYPFLASVYASSGQQDKAVEAVWKGVKADTLDKVCWNLLAYTYAGLNKRKETFEYIDRYLALAPGEPNPYDSKGELFVVFGELDSAVHWFKKAISFRSDFNSSVTLGHIALLKGDDTAADKYYQQYGSTADPSQQFAGEMDQLLVPVHHGKLKAVSVELSEKRAAFETQKSEDALDAIYYALTIVSYETGAYASMLEYARKHGEMHKLNPYDHIYGRDLLAWAYMKNGNAAMAARTLEDLRNDLGENAAWDHSDYEYTAALLEYEQGNYGQALSHFGKAFQPMPPNHAPQLHYAVCLLKTGNIESAIQELQRVARWVPISFPWISATFLPLSDYWVIASAKSHYWLGIAYEQKGQQQMALAEYQIFLDTWRNADFKSPELEDAKTRLAKLKEAM